MLFNQGTPCNQSSDETFHEVCDLPTLFYFRHGGGSWLSLAWQDELALRIIGGGDILAGWHLVDQLAQPIN